MNSVLRRLRTPLLLIAAAVLALTTSTALAGSGVGGVFNLGKPNSVNGMSTLTGSTAGNQLKVSNTSNSGSAVGIYGQSASPSAAGIQGVNNAGGPALQAIVSGNGVSPLKVNSNHVVPNLHAANSDALAGHAPGYFLSATGTAADSSKLGGKLPGGFWQLGGNAVGATGELGTIDNQALELRVFGARALRIEPVLSPNTPNLIGGSLANGNPSGSGAFALTIAGGGDLSHPNRATDNYATIGGGFSNTAGNVNANASDANFATVGGGAQNTAGAVGSNVSGGLSNTATGAESTVAGGFANTASGYLSFVGTGNLNTAGGAISFVGGGDNNKASGAFSAVPGGSANTASGDYSFAAGRRAKATQAGSFVWGDSTDADVISPAANTFTVRASGGTFVHGNANVSGGALSTGVATFPDGDTAPDVSGANVFDTANAAPTNITSLSNGVPGQTITIVCGDDQTIVSESETIRVQGTLGCSAGTGVTLMLVTDDGTHWFEVSRSIN